MVLEYLLTGFLAGGLLVGGCWWWIGRKKQTEQVVVEKEKVEISLQDIIRLAALNTVQDIGCLIIAYKINVKMPEFYEKYQALNKQEKELYFNELIAIFSKNKREYVRDLFDKYPGLSTQDVLLLLMTEMQLDNKTMARIMGLSMETLKKRKTRLKSKMNVEGKPVKEVATA